MLTTARCFVRLSVTLADDSYIFEEVEWDPDWNYFEVFEVAHMNADGALPTRKQCSNYLVSKLGPRDVWDEGKVGQLFAAVTSLRRAEQKLRERSGQ